MSIGQDPIGSYPIGGTNSNASPVNPTGSIYDFDPIITVEPQYGHSPILSRIIRYMGEWFSGPDYDQMVYDILDVDSAKGWGLDVLGRIVVATRTIKVAVPETFLGFEGQPTAKNFFQSILFRGANKTYNRDLTDEVFRRVIKAKAMANYCRGTIPQINAILRYVFPDIPNCYCYSTKEGLVYHFGGKLTAQDFAIISQENILPRPAGIPIIIEQG